MSPKDRPALIETVNILVPSKEKLSIWKALVWVCPIAACAAAVLIFVLGSGPTAALAPNTALLPVVPGIDSNKALGTAIGEGIEKKVQPLLDELVDRDSEIIKSLKNETKARVEGDETLIKKNDAIAKDVLDLKTKVIDPSKVQEAIEELLGSRIKLKKGESLSQFFERLRKQDDEVVALLANFPKRPTA